MASNRHGITLEVGRAVFPDGGRFAVVARQPWVPTAFGDDPPGLRYCLFDSEAAAKAEAERVKDYDWAAIEALSWIDPTDPAYQRDALDIANCFVR